jgi:mono/diheme cytochrome c family protein
MKKTWILIYCLGAALLVRSTVAQEQSNSEKPLPNASGAAPAASAKSRPMHDVAPPQFGGDAANTERMARLEGEKRFRTNCGRCHQPPHKFPPRVMAAAIRHMRVRAMITDEDMKLILRYMTQ